MKRTTRKEENEYLQAEDREICIGIIVDDDICKWAEANWPLKLLESPPAVMIAKWVYDYYRKYKAAPRKNLQKIVEDEKLYGRIPPDILDELYEEILPGLSEQAEADLDFNPGYLLDRMKKELFRRQLKNKNEEAIVLIEKDELDKAGKLLNMELSGDGALDKFIFSLDEMISLKIEKPEVLMRPWLKAGQTTFIYGDYGCGKSLLAIHIASLLALDIDTAMDYDIGQWVVKKSTGCLYVDGEMGVVELRDRLSQFEYLGKQKFPLQGFPLPEYQMATEDEFLLSERTNQKKITHWLQHHEDYKLLVLDSVTTLFGLTDENSNAEWNTKINPMLRDLRALGVAVILLHHSGKDVNRGLRGASAMGAMAHNIFSLKNHDDKDIDEGEAWFTLSKKKQREGGFQFKEFAIHYFQDSSLTETEWETTDKGSSTDEPLTRNQIRIIRHLLLGKDTQKKIAERVGCTQSNIAATKRKAKDLGYLTRDGKGTQLWEDVIERFRNRGKEEDD